VQKSMEKNLSLYFIHTSTANSNLSLINKKCMVDLCMHADDEKLQFFSVQSTKLHTKTFSIVNFFYFHIFYMLDNFLHNQRHCYRPVRTTCSAHRNQIQNCMKEKSDARNLNIFHSYLSWAWMEIYDGFAVTKDDYVDLLGKLFGKFQLEISCFYCGFYMNVSQRTF